MMNEQVENIKNVLLDYSSFELAYLAGWIDSRMDLLGERELNE